MKAEHIIIGLVLEPCVVKARLHEILETHRILTNCQQIQFKIGHLANDELFINVKITYDMKTGKLIGQCAEHFDIILITSHAQMCQLSVQSVKH